MVSKTQLVINIERQLETCTFEEEGEWDKHFKVFNDSKSKLASYKKQFSSTDNVSKFLRTLIFLARFALIAIVVEESRLPFEMVIAPVKEKISHRQTYFETNAAPALAASLFKSNKPHGVVEKGLVKKHKRGFCSIWGNGVTMPTIVAIKFCKRQVGGVVVETGEEVSTIEVMDVVNFKSTKRFSILRHAEWTERWMGYQAHS